MFGMMGLWLGSAGHSSHDGSRVFPRMFSELWKRMNMASAELDDLPIFTTVDFLAEFMQTQRHHSETLMDQVLLYLPAGYLT